MIKGIIEMLTFLFQAIFEVFMYHTGRGFLFVFTLGKYPDEKFIYKYPDGYSFVGLAIWVAAFFLICLFYNNVI